MWQAILRATVNGSPGVPSSARRAAFAGIAPPIAFLAVSFLMAALRPDLIREGGWVGWPSSMALGGAAGIPQISAFLMLAACYPVFALGALRPVVASGVVWRAFLVVASGDVLLAFPTDPVGADISWHGAVHLVGVLVVTLATIAAGVAVTLVTRRRASWRVWRLLGAPAVGLVAVLSVAGAAERGWEKVAYILCVTLPVPLLASLVRRDASRPGLDSNVRGGLT